MSKLIDKIDKNRLPEHIAIIMDGNGRWAKERGLARVFGHKNGVDSVRSVTEAAAELGIKYLTLYTFSTENWGRPAEEVNDLMQILVDAIEKETPRLNKNNIRLTAIGDLDRLPVKARKKLMDCIENTSVNTGLTLVLALSYSSRWEILDAVKKIAGEVKEGKIDPESIDADVFSAHLTTKGIPDPDLMVRTSGEFRISNFLLWQLAYTEFHFTDIHWPAFREEAFYKAIIDFQNRDRRFGK